MSFFAGSSAVCVVAFGAVLTSSVAAASTALPSEFAETGLLCCKSSSQSRALTCMEHGEVSGVAWYARTYIGARVAIVGSLVCLTMPRRSQSCINDTSGS